MESILPKSLATWLLPLCGAILLPACGRQTQPTVENCQSPEMAAKSYLKMISGRSAERLKFEPDEWPDELSGFQVYDKSDKWVAGIVVRDADCTLVFYSTLTI